jgi:hypothetical protein
LSGDPRPLVVVDDDDHDDETPSFPLLRFDRAGQAKGDARQRL